LTTEDYPTTETSEAPTGERPRESEAQLGLVCPFTADLFVDPVKAADGQTYERQDMLDYINRALYNKPGKPIISPSCSGGEKDFFLSHNNLVSNKGMKKRVKNFVARNPWFKEENPDWPGFKMGG